MLFKIFHNVDAEKTSYFKTDAEFIHFARQIAVENGDEELSIIKLGEALDYIDDYCDNLDLTVFNGNLAELEERVSVAKKYPLDRTKIISIIYDYSSDEFETLEDMWELVKKETDVLADELDNLVNYYRDEEIKDYSISEIDYDFYINDTKIQNAIFEQDKFEYKIIDRKEFIDELFRWIGEGTQSKELMKEDLQYLMTLPDDYIFSSISTNEYVAKDDAQFNTLCEELLVLNKTEFKR